MTKKLENPTDVARRHGMDNSLVNGLLRDKLEPVQEFSYGRGVMRLYDPVGADSVIAEYRASVLAQARTRPPASAPDVAAPPPANLAPVLDQLESLDEKLAKLLDQNAVMFRTFTARLDTMQEAIVELATRPDGQPPALAEAAPARAEPPAPPRRLPRVRILGLHDNKVDHIRRDFGRLLDLAFVNADHAATAAAAQATGSDATLVMLDFVNHTVTNKLESAGTPYTLIRGGLTNLRTALADLAAQQQETT